MRTDKRRWCRASGLMVLALLSWTSVVWAQAGAGEKDTTLQEEAEMLGVGVPPLEVPPGSDLELAESGSPRALLKDPAMLRILDDNPAFIYDPTGRRDPMLLPWARAEVMYEELQAIADGAVKDGDWDLAEAAFRRMLRDLTGEVHMQAAMEGLRQVDSMRGQVGARTSRTEPRTAKLPVYVRSHTQGIILDKVRPMVLVGPHLLSEGDLVPQQSVDVYVEKIRGSEVEYRVKDKIFVVELEEGE